MSEDNASNNLSDTLVAKLSKAGDTASLNHWEKAVAISSLCSKGFSHKDIAIRFGWLTPNETPSINKVSRTLSILKMPKVGQELAIDGRVTDLVTLELLRKIYQKDSDTFYVICSEAQKSDISRQYLQGLYDDLAGSDGNKKPAGKAGTHKERSSMPKPSNIIREILVDWRGLHDGKLLLDSPPGDEGYAWMLMENGDKILVELQDLRIIAINY